MTTLEEVIAKKKAREKRGDLKRAKLRAREEAKKARIETRTIQKVLRTKFAKLRRLTKATVHERELRFDYKHEGAIQQFYITLQNHHHEKTHGDVDDYDSDRETYDLYRREPYSADYYELFNPYWQPDLDVADYTSKVIEGIEYFNKERR